MTSPNPLTPEELDELERLADAATPGNRHREALGGTSTVILDTEPPRSDRRIPAYAYDEKRGWCIGYPAIYEDLNGKTDVRYDFICMAHGDAELIAATDPDTIKRLIAMARGEVK